MATLNNNYDFQIKPDPNWFSPYKDRLILYDILDTFDIKDIENYIRKKKLNNIQNAKQ